MALYQKKGQKLHADIGFLDESGISERPTVRRTWSPKGQTPIIESTGSWKRRAATGLITCTPTGRKPKLFLRIFKESITYKEVIQNLKEIRRHIKGKLLLIWDGLPSHRKKEVKEFLETQRSWLQVERFPAYAPELNPVEYLWSTGKNTDLANLYLSDGLEDIDTAVRKYKRRIQRNTDILKGFLKASTLY